MPAREMMKGWRVDLSQNIIWNSSLDFQTLKKDDDETATVSFKERQKSYSMCY